MPPFGECPLPSPPSRGRERVAADSSVAGRLKKNARNINGRNFSGSLYRKADRANATSVFQTTFEPIGRMCAARHARGGVRLRGKWRTRACVPHTPYMRATACCTICFPCRTLNPQQPPRPLSRGRELERGQQAARLLFGRLGCWGRLPKFGECPLPNPPPRGRGQVAADSGVAGRLKKNARNINSRNFQAAFIARQMEQTPRVFFQTTFEPIDRVCAARHARGGLGLQGKWRTRACVLHTLYMRATACYKLLYFFIHKIRR